MRATLRRVAPYLSPAALALIVGALLATMFLMQREGHWWGDDWALYIRQARGLLLGSTDQVALENRFTVEMSDGAPFSPVVYPWGFPFILAMFIPFVGDGVDQLSIVGKLAACVFFVAWYALAKPRIGALGALVGLVAVCATPAILGWADLIQSELPFMAVVGVTLVGLDYLSAEQRLLRSDTRLIWLLLLGVGAAFSFEIRREGLALIPAIFTAHVVMLWRERAHRHQLGRRRWIQLTAQVAVPYLAALVTVLCSRTLFPTVIVAQTGDGTGPANVWRNWGKHVDNMSRLVGLQGPHANEPSVLGNHSLGTAAVITWFVLVVVGILIAITFRIYRDAFLAAFAVAAFVIGCSATATLTRYFAAAAPILSLLALSGVAVIIRRVSGPRWGRWTVPIAMVLLTMPLAIANNVVTKDRIDNAQLAHDVGSIEWGAQHPSAIQMFEAVRHYTDLDDIVAAPKARSMVLLTERWAVQVDDYRPLPPDVDVELIVTERDGRRYPEFSQLSDQWTEVWSNDRFVLFQRVRELPS